MVEDHPDPRQQWLERRRLAQRRRRSLSPTSKNSKDVHIFPDVDGEGWTDKAGHLLAPNLKNFVLRPSVKNPGLWYPDRPPKAQWNRIRKVILERDDYTCRACGHRALKFMNVHHLEESAENTPENLATMCVACHAVLHIGRNLSLKVIEIWTSELPQVEIVKRSRDGVKNGLPLSEINKSLKLKRGPHSPDSPMYANELVRSMGKAARAYLPEPLCVVFINLNRWQLE